MGRVRYLGSTTPALLLRDGGIRRDKAVLKELSFVFFVFFTAMDVLHPETEGCDVSVMRGQPPHLLVILQQEVKQERKVYDVVLQDFFKKRKLYWSYCKITNWSFGPLSTCLQVESVFSVLMNNDIDTVHGGGVMFWKWFLHSAPSQKHSHTKSWPMEYLRMSWQGADRGMISHHGRPVLLPGSRGGCWLCASLHRYWFTEQVLLSLGTLSRQLNL